MPGGLPRSETPAIDPGGSETKPSRPIVSIVIVNFNGAPLLERCLESLESVTYPTQSIEVLVVDNASSDTSLDVVARFPRVRLVRNAENRGFAGGNNVGVRHAKGDIILLLNNDTVVSPGFLEPLVDYLACHPRVGIVQGGMTLPRHGGVLDVCGSFLTAFGFLYHYGYWKPDGPLYRRSYPVFTAKGACLLFRRQVVKDAGGYLFNEAFFCYYEETDFCHRAWIGGWETHYVGGSRIQHWHGATSERSQPTGFALKQFLTNQTFALCANLGFFGLLRIMPLYTGMFLCGWIGAILTRNRTVAAAHRHAALSCLKNLKNIRAQRRMIRAIRRVPDRMIFRRVLRTPGWDYFWKTFRGTIGTYRDGRWVVEKSDSEN